MVRAVAILGYQARTVGQTTCHRRARSSAPRRRDRLARGAPVRRDDARRRPRRGAFPPREPLSPPRRERPPWPRRREPRTASARSWPVSESAKPVDPRELVARMALLCARGSS